MALDLDIPGVRGRWVPAYYRYGERRTMALALLVHMAEGGGTAGFLARSNKHKVSVHFVIERSGALVQMLGLTELSGSIRATSIRPTNDRKLDLPGTGPVTYGRSAALAALGVWSLNPNHAVISVEVEGFAAVGPNASQRRTLVRLARALRANLPLIKANLGHRDFAAYKACPGNLIPWRNMGGHYPAPYDSEA